MKRRDALSALMAGLAAPGLLGAAFRTTRTAGPDFSAVERRAAGRLGVAVLETGTGRRLAYRADERFPMCSTFKWLLAAQILTRVDAGQEDLARVVPYTETDVLAYAPVTREQVGRGGMRVGELAAAAVGQSDNTAGNLLLTSVGGPAAFTSFLRGIGDQVTRLDRMEPDLNSAEPGDVRDTTTPDAMIGDMQRVLLGTLLDDASRERLLAWLMASTTGAEKLRAGMPAAWRIGDKTGAGAHGVTNDLAIIWPPHRQPVLVAAYLRDSSAPADARNGALAEVGRLVAGWIEAS
jgi:beta-lactamase class A